MSSLPTSAHARHSLQASIYDPTGAKAARAELTRLREGKTDFDVLKDEYRFIREEQGLEPDEAEGPSSSSSMAAYGKQLALRFENHLFKEFALVDLKHYKSGRVALRWRTPQEVIRSLGSETCGSLRCPFFDPPEDAPAMPRLEAFELPFAYIEKGEQKTALVKVVCCPKCQKKLMYGFREGREKGGGAAGERRGREESEVVGRRGGRDGREKQERPRSEKRKSRSRSRSPRRRREERGSESTSRSGRRGEDQRGESERRRSYSSSSKRG